MFEFFKKKAKQVDLAAGKLQEKGHSTYTESTKTVDNMTSFEIPDFTEEDLNFDLGLGEFMSEKDRTSIVPQVMPNSQATASSTSQFAPSVNKVSSDLVQPTTQSLSNNQEMQTKQTENKIEPVETFTSKQDFPNEELPKFQVFSPSDSNLDLDVLMKSTPKKAGNYVNNKNKNIEKKETKLVQADIVKQLVEVKFIEKEAYAKTILLSDELTKDTAVAQSQIVSIISNSETQNLDVEELMGTMRSIGDALMAADSKLFGEVDGK